MVFFVAVVPNGEIIYHSGIAPVGQLMIRLIGMKVLPEASLKLFLFCFGEMERTKRKKRVLLPGDGTQPPIVTEDMLQQCFMLIERLKVCYYFFLFPPPPPCSPSPITISQTSFPQVDYLLKQQQHKEGPSAPQDI